MIYVLSGSSSLYAVIAVTYPSGSICTCGGKAAKDTSGYALFPVKAGTYTVECHTSDNSKSKSASVTVASSDRGKSFAVALNYAVYYYDNGDISSLTGGWNNATAGTALSANVEARSDGYAQTLTVTSKNTIDLAEISTIHVIGTMTASGQVSKAKFSIGGSSLSVSGASGQTNELTDFPLDVSSVSSGQFTFTLDSGLGYSAIHISQIYGE